MMDALEILNRPSGAEVSIEERACVVEWYIHERKGVDVKIELNLMQVQTFFGGFRGRNVAYIHPHEQALLNDAFTVACNWYAVSKLPKEK